MNELITNADIEKLEERLLSFPQVTCPVTHRFAPGVYIRECLMPAGSFIIGHEHKTEHFNFALKGRARLYCDGRTEEITAPYTVVSRAGLRKMAHILEDMIWVTIHPTNETDIEKLEEELLVKSSAYINYHSRKEIAA